MGLRAFLGGLAMVLVSSSVAGALITPVKVIAGPGDQYEPHANATWITWGSNTGAHPDHWNAYARLTGGTTVIRVNAAGTQGQPGGIEPGTDRIIYDQWTSKDGGIFLFNPDTRHRSKVPDVNTTWWEGNARISTAYVFFQRWVWRSGHWYVDLLLYDRSAGQTKRIASWRDSAKRFVYTGGVGERYATWTLCALPECHAFVFDAQDKTIRKVSTTNNGAYQYAPAVDELHGMLYYARSGAGCGKHAGVWRVPVASLGATPEQVAALPAGIDTGWTLGFAPSADGTMLDILFERWICAKETGDIYSIPGVATLP